VTFAVTLVTTILGYLTELDDWSIIDSVGEFAEGNFERTGRQLAGGKDGQFHFHGSWQHGFGF
jgi:hypothetical protein